MKKELEKFGKIIMGSNPRTSINQILSVLTYNEVIDPQFAEAIQDVIKVCNPIIHGEETKKNTRILKIRDGVIESSSKGVLEPTIPIPYPS